MGTIKLRRGSGSPAGSLAQYEVAMDVADKTLYTSSDGSDAVIIGADPKHFLANNTISGIKNVANNYSEIAAFESKTLANNNTVGIELQRNLSTDGAVSGRDTRGVAQLYAVYSDSGNTNGSATAIYPGGLVGQSGSNDGTSPHWLQAITYDNGITSFNEEVMWEGTKDEFHVYPPTEFHNTIQLGSQASDPTGVDGMMYYNTTTNQFRIKANGLWGDVDSTVTSTTLAALTDVDITSPANGQALVYNSATSKWENATASTNTVMTMKTKVQLGSYTGTIGEKVLCTDAEWAHSGTGWAGEWIADECVWLTQNSITTWWRGGGFTSAFSQQVEFNLINIGECVNGQTYTIKEAYGSDFTLIGAANNNAGTVFTATGPGTGNGQCYT